MKIEKGRHPNREQIDTTSYVVDGTINKPGSRYGVISGHRRMALQEKPVPRSQGTIVFQMMCHTQGK
jgi:hypothetical protein